MFINECTRDITLITSLFLVTYFVVGSNIGKNSKMYIGKCQELSKFCISWWCQYDVIDHVTKIKEVCLHILLYTIPWLYFIFKHPFPKYLGA